MIKFEECNDCRAKPGSPLLCPQCLMLRELVACHNGALVPDTIPDTPVATIDNLAFDIREVNKANGWDLIRQNDWVDKYRIPAALALIHSEVSEALEAFRESNQEHFIEELADVLIRVLDCVGGLTYSFDKAVRDKIETNRGRGHRHGGKKI